MLTSISCLLQNRKTLSRRLPLRFSGPHQDLSGRVFSAVVSLLGISRRVCRLFVDTSKCRRLRQEHSTEQTPVVLRRHVLYHIRRCHVYLLLDIRTALPISNLFVPHKVSDEGFFRAFFNFLKGGRVKNERWLHDSGA